MKITLNLATRPFVELGPTLLRLRLLMGGLLAVAAGLTAGSYVLGNRLDAQNRQIDGLRERTIAVQTKRLRTESRLREGENAAILDRAHFLNRLFLTKSFSWTAVMMDLEQVLPTGVQVVSIEPQVTSEGGVVIRLRVAGDRDRAVQLVRNLEHSRRFLQPRLASESAQTKEGQPQGGALVTRNGQPPAPQGPPTVDFDILADYNPLPEGERYARVKTTSVVSAPAMTGMGQGGRR